MTVTLAVSAASVAATAADVAAEATTNLYLGNWSGYVVHGDIHEVSAGWVQPEIDCRNPGVLQRVVPWVGLNGANAVDGRLALPLVQTGVESVCVSEAAIYAATPGLQVENFAAGLAYGDAQLSGTVMKTGARLSDLLGGATDGLCSLGFLDDVCRPQKYVDAWWESYPDAPVGYDVAAGPGDAMRSTVSWDGRRYVMTLDNQTRGWTRTTVIASTAPARTAEIVVEGHLDAALPGFTPVVFTDIAIDGKPLSEYPADVYGIRAANRTLIPGPIDGSSFTVG